MTLQRFLKNPPSGSSRSPSISSSASSPSGNESLRPRKPLGGKSRKTKSDGFVFAIAGAHGVGKTTVYELLQKRFDSISQVQLFP